jgi:hypothetical protein
MKQKASMVSGFMLGLLFNPEDGGSTFLQNVGQLSTHYMVLHPKEWYFS